VSGQQYELEITGLTQRGQGVGRAGAEVVFVPFAVPGDRVLVSIAQRRRNYWLGEIVRVITPSPARSDPPCSVYEPCGACQLQGLRYEAQLEWKQAAVRDALRRIGRLGEVQVHPTWPAPQPWEYRNKAGFPVGRQRGRLVAGCYAAGTHHIVDTQSCLIQHPVNNAILARSREVIAELGLSIYDPGSDRGFVRYIMGRVAPGTGEAMAIIVTRTRRFPQGRRYGRALMQAVPGLQSVVQNVNPARTNIMLGPETHVLAGKQHIDDILGNDELGRLRFRISPLSFYQVNSAQAVNLYAFAVRYAGLTGVETVLDLYTGVGSLALFLARRARAVLGVEEVAAAVADARTNARLNHIENARFMTGRAEQVLPRLLGERFQAGVVVFDPPRAGCDQEVLRAAARLKPKRMVYVSCYPATLARDLAYLGGLGYAVREVQPVDMFPMTTHVECVALVTLV
jgi:23S rRNA (uracil1939-C5)-methyltransferase